MTGLIAIGTMVSGAGEEAVQSEIDAVNWLNDIYENDTASKLVSLDEIDPANVMIKSLIVDEIVLL